MAIRTTGPVAVAALQKPQMSQIPQINHTLLQLVSSEAVALYRVPLKVDKTRVSFVSGPAAPPYHIEALRLTG
ncbi:hypothetical protein CGRA01v4_14400 [Colletotrichum graminicola]|nr:hypothetical protein CGRA01v4_14400 [Colletotrichum graminicola]